MLQRRMPDRYERYVRMRDENPMAYRAALRDLWGWYARWKNASPEVQDAFVGEQLAQTRINQIVRRLAQAGDDERQRLLEELRKTVAEHFDAEYRIQQAKLESIEEQIETLRSEMSQRSEQRSALIQERFERWLRASTQPAASRPTSGPGAFSRPAKGAGSSRPAH